MQLVLKRINTYKVLDLAIACYWDKDQYIFLQEVGKGREQDAVALLLTLTNTSEQLSLGNDCTCFDFSSSRERGKYAGLRLKMFWLSNQPK